MKSPDSALFTGSQGTLAHSAQPQRIGVGVLIFTTGYGGADTIVFNWLQALQSIPSIQLYLFTFAKPERFLAKAAGIGIPVYQLPWSRRKPLLRATKILADYARRFNLDILHCHNPYADFVGCLLKRYIKIKTVMTFHAWGEPEIRVKILEWLDLFISRFFDQITAASEAVRLGAIERGVPEERIKTVQVCTATAAASLTPEVRTARRATFGVGAEDLVFISLARCYPVKRYDVMLRALRSVAQLYPNTRLWIVGDGPEEAMLQKLAEHLGVTRHVQFLGYRADATELLSLADVQLLTSDTEGLPMAILEGMAASLPIIATKVGSLPNVLVDGQSVVFTRPGNVDDVITAAIDLIQHPLKRHALGEAARRIFTESYAPECGAASMAALYKDLVTVPS